MTLKIKDVVKYFEGVHALNSCSLDIKNNHITALIGPNGSGKTTLFNIISGLIKKDSGSILFNGKNIIDMSDVDISKEGLSRTFQTVEYFKNLTVKEHMEIASIPKEKIDKLEIKKTLELVGLEEKSNSLVDNLSYGQKKLIDLAVAIINPHKLLMLDEPVSVVNPKISSRIVRLLKELKSNGETILLIEHDLNFVMETADYIYVLNEGKIIAEGTPKEIINNKKVLKAYIGE